MNEELLDELRRVDPKSIKSDIFQDLLISAYVYNVHDADTISILFKFNDSYCKKNIRLLGIDAPEIKSKIKEEKNLAIKGRDFLKEQILNKLVQISMLKLDKYGRQLGIVYYQSKNINEDLIKGGFCRSYDGKRKEKWDINEELKILDNID